MGKTALLTAAVFGLLLAPAGAKDLLPQAPSLDDLTLRGGFTEETGLYMRGDLGASLQRTGMRPSTFSSGVAGFQQDSLDMSRASMVGIGIGYQIAEWWRMDLTADYRSGDFISRVSYTSGSDVYRTDVHSSLILVNSYFEAGSWFDVTPYIGLGIGYTRNVTGRMTIADNGVHGGGSGQGATTNALALSLAAGLAWEMSERIKLDIGYRYLHLGSINTGALICATSGTPCNGGSQTARLSGHDLRAGLRYALGEAPRLMSFAR